MYNHFDVLFLIYIAEFVFFELYENLTSLIYFVLIDEPGALHGLAPL